MVPIDSSLHDWTTKSHKQKSENGSVRGRPARLNSGPSMLGSGFMASNYSATRWKQEAHDLFGLKKLARAYFRTSESFAKEEVNDYGVERFSKAQPKPQNKRPSSGTVIQLDRRLPQTSDGTTKSLLPQKRQNYSISVGSLIDQGKSSHSRTSKLSVHPGDSSGEFSHISECKLGRSGIVNEKSLLEGGNLGTTAVHAWGQKLAGGTDRIVQINDIPRDSGIQSLIAQIYGGPLEKIQVTRDPYNPTAIKSVLLYFMSQQAANSFIHYGRTTNLRVNGHVLKPEWVTKSSDNLSNLNVERIREVIESKGAQKGQDSSGARRCIIVKKTGGSGHSRSRQMYSSRQNLCPLDIKDLRQDFENFGNIVEISPMISRKLCLCVTFYDVSSSIGALESFEKPNSYLNKKYGRDWSIAYGRDTADRPCYRSVY